MEQISKTPIMIIGTEAEARIALDIANLLEVTVFGYLTEEPEELNKEINDVLVVAELGGKDSNTLMEDPNIKLALAMREIKDRIEAVASTASFEKDWVNLFHPSVEVSPYAKLGRGNLIGANTIIQANALFGSFNQVGNYVSIEPDAEIGDYCNIQTGAKIGRGAMLSEGVTVGMGAIIYPGVHLGPGATVGPGSVVLTDVPEREQVFGNPAQSV
ncbi:MAG: hypothetical protein AAFQ87_11170 [Bacteroidota bacterium]